MADQRDPLNTDTLREIIEDAGYDTHSYSGRGMYGKECLAYEADSCEVLYSVAQIMESAFSVDKGEEMTQVFRLSKTDSMGRDDIIIYFPKFEVKE